MRKLTVEELKNLEVGEWVWVSSKENNGEYKYIQKMENDENFFAFYYFYSDYGYDWIAYSNK